MRGMKILRTGTQPAPFVHEWTDILDLKKHIAQGVEGIGATNEKDVKMPRIKDCGSILPTRFK
jgi:predicted secreted protein